MDRYRYLVTKYVITDVLIVMSFCAAAIPGLYLQPFVLLIAHGNHHCTGRLDFTSLLSLVSIFR